MAKETFDILSVEEYEHQGEQRKKFHNVGTAWPLEKGGMSVEIHPNIAVGGRLVILPRKAKDAAEA